MKVSVQESPMRPGTYRVVLHTGRRAAFDEFLRHVEESSTITRADALAVLTAAADWLHQQAAGGREADLGPLGRSRLGMKGVFASMPQRIEDADVTLSIGWVLPRALRRGVTLAGRKLPRERVEPAPKQPSIAEARRILAGAEPDPHPGRYTPGEPLRLYGARLNYDTSRADEGVFLVAEDHSVTRVEQVFTNEPKQVAF
ncbi:MAG: hypothetical protein JXO22_15830, partial [Phycisphaerae bacterium]|nr:hypothetical protein [Phycisphaerae bacterium]